MTEDCYIVYIFQPDLHWKIKRDDQYFELYNKIMYLSPRVVNKII